MSGSQQALRLRSNALKGRTYLMPRDGRGKRVVITRYRHGVKWEGSLQRCSRSLSTWDWVRASQNVQKLLSENERDAAMIQTTSSDTDLTTTSPFVLTLLTTPGSAALQIENSELPVPIQVDETEHREVTRRLGAGVQVYDRQPDGTFGFREPQADLYDLDTVTLRGIHFVGPERGTAQWADADGSRVVARVVESVDAPAPGDPTKDVKWLKVQALTTFGDGVFDGLTFIQRVLTYGGQVPPSCNSTTISVPYTTLYIFWAAR